MEMFLKIVIITHSKYTKKKQPTKPYTSNDYITGYVNYISKKHKNKNWCLGPTADKINLNLYRWDSNNSNIQVIFFSAANQQWEPLTYSI